MKKRTITLKDNFIKFVKGKKIEIKAGIPQKLFEIIPDRQKAIVFMNNQPWQMKLRDENNQEIDINSTLTFAFIPENQMLVNQVTDDIRYRPFFLRVDSEQTKDDYINSLRVEYVRNGRPLDILLEQEEKTAIYIKTNKDITIDIEKSFINIPAVEMTMDELRAYSLENSPVSQFRG